MRQTRPRGGLCCTQYAGGLADNTGLPRAPQATSRLPWAELLKRAFGLDVLTCDRCCGARRIIAFIEQPAVTRRILEYLGMPLTGPPRAGPRPPPQLELLDSLPQPAFL